jgi:tetratricopeptide (TPR) repeat protein
MDRVETFKTFISRTPGDPFPRYGLAMEYKTSGRLAEAWATFQELIEKFPDYVPSYLMAGGTLVALGQAETARGVYERGIEAATRRGDLHARKELESALAELSPA